MAIDMAATIAGAGEIRTGDRAHLRDAILIRRRHPTPTRAGAAPDLVQRPVPEQVPAQVNLVVAGLLWIEPGMMLWEVVHDGQFRRCGGSSGEPAEIFSRGQMGRTH